MNLATLPFELLFLGTGTSTGVPMIGCDCPVCTSADPRNRRLRSSLYLRLGGVALLVDTATDLREQAIAHRIRQVDAVLFTHAHADHVFGLDDLRRFNTLQENQAIPAYAVPEQDTPEFGEYLQGLERNGFHLQPDTAWRLAHQTCDGGLPGFIGWELTAQGVVGPGNQLKATDVARKYLCPIQ